MVRRSHRMLGWLIAAGSLALAVAMLVWIGVAGGFEPATAQVPAGAIGEPIDTARGEIIVTGVELVDDEGETTVLAELIVTAAGTEPLQFLSEIARVSTAGTEIEDFALVMREGELVTSLSAGVPTAISWQVTFSVPPTADVDFDILDATFVSREESTLGFGERWIDPVPVARFVVPVNS